MPEKERTLAVDPLFEIMLFKIVVVCSSGSFLLHMIIIFAPFSANLLAIAWPMPVPLPVIRATLLETFKDD